MCVCVCACTSTSTSTSKPYHTVPWRTAKWCAQCDESRIMFTYTVVSSCTHIPSVCVYVRYYTDTALHIPFSVRSYPFSSAFFAVGATVFLQCKNFTRNDFPLVEEIGSIKKALYGKNAKWTRIKMWKRRTEKIVLVFFDALAVRAFFFKQSHTTFSLFSLWFVHVFNHYHFMLGFNEEKNQQSVFITHTCTLAQTQNRSYIGRVIEFPTFRKMTLHFHTVIHIVSYPSDLKMLYRKWL